jgi:hypothetical protein
MVGLKFVADVFATQKGRRCNKYGVPEPDEVRDLGVFEVSSEHGGRLSRYGLHGWVRVVTSELVKSYRLEAQRYGEVWIPLGVFTGKERVVKVNYSYSGGPKYGPRR